MKISYNCLNELIKLPKDIEQVAKELTALGLEVEGLEKYEQIPGSLEGLVIAEVLSCVPHPNADRLRLTTVDIGSAEAQPIVCGAPNVAAGQKVVVATVGSTLHPFQGDAFEIKKAKIRGEVSLGMICAEDEIGLGEEHDGIMVLNTDLPNGTPAAEYFKPSQDWVFEIGLTPNRADAASHLGVARDLKAHWQQDICPPAAELEELPSGNSSFSVKVENLEACPRYSGILMEGIAVKESPSWLKNILLAIGVRPINNVVDITNYVLHNLGQPLHAFDLDKIKGNGIRVKTLDQGTEFISLDEEKRSLSEQDLMICDAEDNPLCIGGVFGGVESGVSESTQALFLESAYFDPAYIRRSAQFHGLKTDASFRFERGTDPNGTVYALKVACQLITQLAGGKISAPLVDIYPNKIENFQFTVKYKNVNRLIGKEMDPDFIHRLLQNLGIEILNQDEGKIEVSVPPYRVDVQREADLIEEIARFYGYDNLEVGEELGSTYLAEFPAKDAHKIQYQMSQMLAANGFSEMMNNSLTKPSYREMVPEWENQKPVEILNYLSEDLKLMRQTLLFSGLEVLAYNLNRRQNDLKLFEFGKVYYMEESDEGLEKYREEYRLSIVMTGNQAAEHWRQTKQPLEYFDLADISRKVLQKMNLDQVQGENIQDGELAYGQNLIYKNQSLVKLGQVKPELCQAFGIKAPVFYASFDWEKLLQKYQSKVQFEPISKYPEVRRDLSLVLDASVSFQDIHTLAFKVVKKNLKELNVFDVYQGPNIEEGKKAYAISFILEDQYQTLSDKLIDKLMSKIRKSFERELGAFIRE